MSQYQIVRVERSALLLVINILGCQGQLKVDTTYM